MTEKEKFCKDITVIIDSREQQYRHITDVFERSGIKYEISKLDFGDYSFRCADRDFSLSCIIERKANINELWTNVTSDRERFEKEIRGISLLTGSAVLIVENCVSREWLQGYKVPDWQMKNYNRKVQDIGKIIDSTMRAWESSNRYKLQVHCVSGTDSTAKEILSIFYYYYRNFKENTAKMRGLK